MATCGAAKWPGVLSETSNGPTVLPPVFLTVNVAVAMRPGATCFEALRLTARPVQVGGCWAIAAPERRTSARRRRSMVLGCGPKACTYGRGMCACRVEMS